MIKSREGGLLLWFYPLVPASLLGPNNSTHIQMGGGVQSGPGPGVPVCLYIVRTWPESTSPELAGGARRLTSELAAPARRLSAPARAAQPRVGAAERRAHLRRRTVPPELS